MKVDYTIYKKITNRISRKKTDWLEYRNIVKRMEEELKDELKLISNWEDKYEKLKKIMIHAVQKAIGKIKKEGETEKRILKNIRLKKLEIYGLTKQKNRKY